MTGTNPRRRRGEDLDGKRGGLDYGARAASIRIRAKAGRGSRGRRRAGRAARARRTRSDRWTARRRFRAKRVRRRRARRRRRRRGGGAVTPPTPDRRGFGSGSFGDRSSRWRDAARATRRAPNVASTPPSPPKRALAIARRGGRGSALPAESPAAAARGRVDETRRRRRRQRSRVAAARTPGSVHATDERRRGGRCGATPWRRDWRRRDRELFADDDQGRNCSRRSWPPATAVGEAAARAKAKRTDARNAPRTTRRAAEAAEFVLKPMPLNGGRLQTVRVQGRSRRWRSWSALGRRRRRGIAAEDPSRCRAGRARGGTALNGRARELAARSGGGVGVRRRYSLALVRNPRGTEVARMTSQRRRHPQPGRPTRAGDTLLTPSSAGQIVECRCLSALSRRRDGTRCLETACDDESIAVP